MKDKSHSALPRRTYRSDLPLALEGLRQPMADEVQDTAIVVSRFREGAHFERLDRGAARCDACGHRCKIYNGGAVSARCATTWAARYTYPGVKSATPTASATPTDTPQATSTPTNTATTTPTPEGQHARTVADLTNECDSGGRADLDETTPNDADYAQVAGASDNHVLELALSAVLDPETSAGSSVQLSAFRGNIVVLIFMDSQCQEVCPLTSAHLRRAHGTLETAQAEAVVFLAINVDVEANRTEDVRATMENWRLNEIPGFHILPGSEAELAPGWEAYNGSVYPAPHEEGELLHTPGVFLIDRQGQMRWYVSTPFDEASYVDGTSPLSELLVKRIRELLQEP